MHVDGFILKRPSAKSKGLICLRFNNSIGPYPEAEIRALKCNWHFFYFCYWGFSLANIAYHSLIDIFIVWDDLIEEIKATGRTDCVIIRGGSETYEPRNKFFFPKVEAVRDIDIVYIARFVNFKRYDIALKCVNYVKRHKPDCRAIFLEPGYSDAGASEWVAAEKIRLGLDNNLIITRGGWRKVNRILNRSRISLFTSDNEGMCRAVLESLLAERPVLCYRQTRAVIRLIYDSRYFHYYDEQTEESVGEAAWKLLQSGAETNQGARKYILKEKAMKFHDLIGWQSEVLNAARVLYARDGQRLEPNDIVPWNELSQDNRFWKEFELISD